ncbi:MAG: chemotaxis protein CheB [Kofleriaceae bacterium]
MDVIAIGGSAGALEVVLALMRDLPESFEIPVVVVMHLPPTPPSMLPTLLANATKHSVYEIEDKQPLVAGAIYVAPPNYHVLIERERTFSLSVDAPVNYSRPSIDVLFESASAFGASAAGVVLSGANDDGARGLAQIVAAGGIGIVQDPETAAYPTMPLAAVRLVGSRARIVLPGDIAGALAALSGRHLQ